MRDNDLDHEKATADRPEVLQNMMLQIISSLQNTRVHLPHHSTQFLPEPAQNILLPCVVLGVHPGLYLLIIHHTAHAEGLLSFTRVER